MIASGRKGGDRFLAVSALGMTILKVSAIEKRCAAHIKVNLPCEGFRAGASQRWVIWPIKPRARFHQCVIKSVSYNSLGE
jgi:hypothetical protein